jgi:hypothetical protein
MDYDRDKLEEDSNPIAIVVLASQERELAKQRGEMFNANQTFLFLLFTYYFGNKICRLP